MAFSQKALKEKLDEWAILELRIKKSHEKKNKELDPFIKQHNEQIKPILDAHDKRIAPLNEKAEQLGQEINSMLLANADADGNPKLLTISGEKASVSVSRSEGSRVVSVAKFFDAVKEKTSDFWNCITVQVAKAEKLIGKKELDEISQKKVSYNVSISLNK